MSVINRAVRMLSHLAGQVVRKELRERHQVYSSQPDRQPTAEQQGQHVREFNGTLPDLSYTPHSDGHPDPGEVVWAWVPYDENNGQGKDRPVLIIAEYDGGLLGLQLTSKDHGRDAAEEARWGRFWVDVGTGNWDRQGRPSEARLDRVLWFAVDAVRREGGALKHDRFDEAIAALREHRHGN